MWMDMWELKKGTYVQVGKAIDIWMKCELNYCTEVPGRELLQNRGAKKADIKQIEFYDLSYHEIMPQDLPSLEY